MSELYIVSKAGNLRSGHDNMGTIYHYVDEHPHQHDRPPALCGARPAIMWSLAREHEGRKVTCKKCERLAKTCGEVRG